MNQIPTIPTQLTTVTSNPVETVPVQGKKEIALQKAGATREVAYKTMVDGLEAMSMTVDKFGEEHFTPDHSSRLKASELISRLNGDLKTDVVVDNRQVTINGVSDSVVTELLHMVKDVANQLSELKGSGRQTGEIIDISVG